MPRSTRISQSGLQRENDPPLLILLSLASGPKHGHALINDIETLVDVRLGPGTLYGAITRLEQEGLIEALPPEARRRPYRITELGLASLSQVLDSMEATVTLGRTRLANRKTDRRIRVGLA